MSEREMRQLLAALIYCLRVSFVDRQTMLGTLRASAKKSKVLEGWERTYKDISMNPPASVLKIVDAQLLPLEEILTRDLDEEGLRDILAHAQKLENYFRSDDRQ